MLLLTFHLLLKSERIEFLPQLHRKFLVFGKEFLREDSLSGDSDAKAVLEAKVRRLILDVKLLNLFMEIIQLLVIQQLGRHLAL